MWCHGCSSYQILKVTNFCRLFLQSISCSISFPISPTPSYPLLSELLSIFPCFSYYRSFLILIILPTSNLFSCHFIIHVADKLVIKHSFNLVISPTWRLHQLSTTYRWSPKGLFWQFKTQPHTEIGCPLRFYLQLFFNFKDIFLGLGFLIFLKQKWINTVSMVDKKR